MFKKPTACQQVRDRRLAICQGGAAVKIVAKVSSSFNKPSESKAVLRPACTIVGQAVTRDSALDWERKRIEGYQVNHDGHRLRYNKV